MAGRTLTILLLCFISIENVVAYKSNFSKGQALRCERPEYSERMKQEGAKGVVQIVISVDEKGDVTSAKAVSGHPLLREVAVAAAKNWKFIPVQFEKKPVPVQGFILFTFTRNRKRAGATYSFSVPPTPTERRKMIWKKCS